MANTYTGLHYTMNDIWRDDSAVADATENCLGIGNRGLKATAKVMPTLRVENQANSSTRP